LEICRGAARLSKQDKRIEFVLVVLFRIGQQPNPSVFSVPSVAK